MKSQKLRLLKIVEHPKHCTIDSGIAGISAIDDANSVGLENQPMDLLSYIDAQIDVIKPSITYQGEQLDSYKNRIGDNVNRNRNLRLLFDDYKVDLNKMRYNCHLFSHDHKYGAKYIQKLSDDEFDNRINTLDVLLTPHFEQSMGAIGQLSNHQAKRELIGSLVEKFPNLLNPLFDEMSKWYDICNYFALDDTKVLGIQAGSFGRMIRKCPHLLSRPVEQVDQTYRTLLHMASKIEPCNIFLSTAELKKMMLRDPSIMLESSDRTLFRLRVFFDYKFSSGKVKRILEGNPSVLTSRFNRVRESDSKMYSDFEQHILFLINECGFSLEQISYNPLLLTTTRTHLIERILFLRSINRAKFNINSDPDYFPIGSMCQQLSNDDGDVPKRVCPLVDLKLFCDELRIDQSEYISFIKTL